LVNYTLTSLDPNDRKILNCFSTTQSEIDIFPTKPAGDSTLIKLAVTDSLSQQRDSIFYVKQTTARSQKDKIKISSTTATFNEDAQKLYTELTSSELLQSILFDSIFIQIDSTQTVSFKPEDIKFDTVHRIIRLEKLFQRKDSIKWKNKKLTLASMAFTSIHGDSSKRQVIPITYITPEETATLIIETATTKPNTLIELLDERYNSLQMTPHAKLLAIKNIKPGTIFLRAVFDTNNNGKWDPGNPNLKILPEEILYYTNPEGKQQIPLRANWEVNIKWNF